MKNNDQELISSLHRSVEQIMSMFKLVKASPPDLSAKSIVDYARLIEKLLGEFYAVIPKMCVPMSLFRKIEKESLEISDLAEKYLQEHRKSLIEIKVLEDKLKEAEEKQRVLVQEKNSILKNNQYYRKKAQSLKKSGEQSLKNLIEVTSPLDSKAQKRQSLPRLDQKQKLAMLYLMGPVSNNNQRLVYHLFNKK